MKALLQYGQFTTFIDIPEGREGKPIFIPKPRTRIYLQSDEEKYSDDMQKRLEFEFNGVDHLHGVMIAFYTYRGES